MIGSSFNLHPLFFHSNVHSFFLILKSIYDVPGAMQDAGDTMVRKYSHNQIITQPLCSYKLRWVLQERRRAMIEKTLNPDGDLEKAALGSLA